MLGHHVVGRAGNTSEYSHSDVWVPETGFQRLAQSLGDISSRYAFLVSGSAVYSLSIDVRRITLVQKSISDTSMHDL